MSTYFTGGNIWGGFGKKLSSLRISNGLIAETNGVPHPGDEVIDLKGTFLAPAFMDGHAHPLFGGREGQGPHVNGIQSVDEIVAEVKRFADANPNMPWIIGGAYEAAIIERGDFLATWLDDAVSDRPVVLQAVDHHTIWVNSKALEIAGITASTVDPDGGTIARNSDGSPRGTLREPAAMALITSHAPTRTIDDDVAAIQWACERYLESGVTAATDAWIEPGMAEAYIEASRRGLLSIDFKLCFLAQPDSWRTRINYFAELRKTVESLGSESMLAAKTIKFIGDGALSAGTAALLEPYLDDPSSSGLLIWDTDEMIDAATLFDEQGYQLHIHGIGDAAVRQALDVIEAVTRVNPKWDRRPVIVHAQLISEIDLPRFEALGVIANYQPLWMYLDPMNKELIAPRIGDTRNDLQYQLASIVKTGARISYGSDWPVTSYIPLAALAVPTHRQSPEGQPPAGWSAHEAVSVEESLSFYTEGVAYQHFEEKIVGRFEVGFAADMVILNGNPLAIDPREVSSLKVLATYKRGKRHLNS
jgi:predicted amidohydrolase YtcJ